MDVGARRIPMRAAQGSSPCRIRDFCKRLVSPGIAKGVSMKPDACFRIASASAERPTKRSGKGLLAEGSIQAWRGVGLIRRTVPVSPGPGWTGQTGVPKSEREHFSMRVLLLGSGAVGEAYAVLVAKADPDGTVA